METLALDLSECRGLPEGELKRRMIERYYEMKAMRSRYALRDVKKNTNCASCIKQCRADVMRHFQVYDWVDNGRLELKSVDPLDKRPIYQKVQKDG